jgi:hypothetical protein
VRFASWGLCPECRQPNDDKRWCKTCSQQDFSRITSGNKRVDDFIQKYQSEAVNRGKKKALFWIPYKEFTSIEHIADGGLGKVYRAE